MNGKPVDHEYVRRAETAYCELERERAALKAEVERLRAALTWVRSNPGKGSLVVIDYIDAALRGEEVSNG